MLDWLHDPAASGPVWSYNPTKGHTSLAHMIIEDFNAASGQPRGSESGVAKGSAAAAKNGGGAGGRGAAGGGFKAAPHVQDYSLKYCVTHLSAARMLGQLEVGGVQAGGQVP